jgi:hypothetical protein
MVNSSHLTGNHHPQGGNLKATSYQILSICLSIYSTLIFFRTTFPEALATLLSVNGCRTIVRILSIIMLGLSFNAEYNFMMGTGKFYD